MKRGELVSVAVQGDYGKPRPALIIQADQYDAVASVTVLPVTGTLVDAPLLRVTLQPNPDNGLSKPSQVMVDKAVTVKREKVGGRIGQVDAGTLLEIERCLAVFLGIAK